MDSEIWPGFGQELSRISTEWAIVYDPGEFVHRYATAVQKYLNALIRNPHDAEEVGQDFFLFVTEHGFPRAKRERGRFRDYLKTAVRNSALTFLRRKRLPTRGDSEMLESMADQGPPVIPDQEWITQWRQCLMDRAWRSLEEHQQQAPDNIYYTALRLMMTSPGEDSKALAAKAARIVGRPITAEAFRKQISRARRKLAGFIVREIAQSLDNATPTQVEEELVDLGLIEYVRDFLPPDWHKKGKFTEPR
jgi:RNA polymerase sigma-70 factor (ECF subfamily)